MWPETHLDMKLGTSEYVTFGKFLYLFELQWDKIPPYQIMKIIARALDGIWEEAAAAN